MKVDIRGALRFRGRPALEKGIEAFDDSAYPEFFRSELWAIEGPCVFTERSFEIEADCDYSRAFVAIAQKATDGCIDLRESGSKHKFNRIVKLGRPINRFVKMELDERFAPEKFGAPTSKLRGAWADVLSKAREAAGEALAKEAKKAGKKPAMNSRALDLPASATSVIALSDGGLAIAAGSKVIFLDAAGQTRGAVEASVEEYDQFAGGITGLVEIDRGHVVAFQELDGGVRIASADVERAEPWPARDEEIGSVKGVARVGDNGGFVILGTHNARLRLEGGSSRVLDTRSEDYLRGAYWHEGRIVLWSFATTHVFETSGKEAWRAPGEVVSTLSGGRLLLRRDSAWSVVDGEARALASFNPGTVYGKPPCFFVDDDIIVATAHPHVVGRWSLKDGTAKWQSPKIHVAAPSGCVRVSGVAVTFAGPPFIREKDTSLAFFSCETGAEIGRVDVKAPVLGAAALGEDALAVFVEGRTPGNKVHLYRGVSGNPRATVLGGHTGRVRGLLAWSEGRLVSWAGDRTLRIWNDL